ncbi:unnamed protein product [Malus baccata var. baccata]
MGLHAFLVRKYVVLPWPCITSTAATLWPRGRRRRRKCPKKLITLAMTLGMMTISHTHTPFAVEVYSLARGSWKSFSAAVLPDYGKLGGVSSKSVFVNGTIQLRDKEEQEHGQEHINIMSFDLSTELFGKIMMPEALRKRGSNCVFLKYGESLALIEIAENLWCQDELVFVDSINLLTIVAVDLKTNKAKDIGMFGSSIQLKSLPFVEMFTMPYFASRPTFLIVDFPTKQSSKSLNGLMATLRLSPISSLSPLAFVTTKSLALPCSSLPRPLQPSRCPPLRVTNVTGGDPSSVDYSSITSVFPAEACETVGGEACDAEMYPEVKLKPEEGRSSTARTVSEQLDRDYLEYDSPKTVFPGEACDDLGGEFCEPEYQRGKARHREPKGFYRTLTVSKSNEVETWISENQRKKAMSINCFPEEIVAVILVRLPFKSVIKVRRVCKTWNSVIKSCTFIDTYLRRSLLIQSEHENNSDGRHHLLLRKKNGWYGNSYYSYYGNILSSPSGYAELIKPAIPDVIKRCFSHLSMVGTCNGIICLAHDGLLQDEDAPTIIWNPSVRKYVILPSPNIKKNNFKDTQTYFFGYDSLTNDYKVLRIVTVRNSLLGVEVYSLANGCWTSLSTTATAVFPAYLCSGFLRKSKDAFFKGAMHWVLPRDRNSKEHLIVSFDFGTELFHEIVMPEGFRKTGCPCYILRYGDSLALVQIDNGGEHFVYGLHLWVMKEYGAVKSWTKLDNNNVLFKGYRPTSPLGFNSCDELVMKILVDGDRRAIVVDFKTGNKNAATVLDGYSSMNPFVQSLILLSQPNAVSY